ncbi:MAG: hypothetical protein ACKVTZ_22145 [Bacteroidia bacterium]
MKQYTLTFTSGLFLLFGLFPLLLGFKLVQQPPILGLWHLIQMKTGDKKIEIAKHNPNMSLQFLGNGTMIRRNSETDWEFFTYVYQEKDSIISTLEVSDKMKVIRYSADSLQLRLKNEQQEVILIYTKHKY